MNDISPFDRHVLASLRGLGSGQHPIRRILDVVRAGAPPWPRPRLSCNGSFCMTGCWHETEVAAALERLHVLHGLARMERNGGSRYNPRLYSLVDPAPAP